MPSAIPTAKGAAAVAAKHADLAAQYRAHKAEVVELQRQAIAELVPSVSDELELQEEGRARARAFLEDKGEPSRSAFLAQGQEWCELGSRDRFLRSVNVCSDHFPLLPPLAV